MFHAIMEMLLEYGWIGLLLVSLAEASFLPVMPDLILIPLVGAAPENGFLYGSLALGGSVIGSLFGHLIGLKAGAPILRKFMKEETMAKVWRMFERFGIWAIIIAGLIPLPFKLFTIAAGVFRVKRSSLMLGALIGRGVRFFAIVMLVRQIGVITIPEGLEMQALAGLLVLLGAAVLYFYLRSAKGTWLREKLTGLVKFFQHDFLAPVRKGSWVGGLFLVLGIVGSLMLAVFGGDMVVALSQNLDETVSAWVHGTITPAWNRGAMVIDWAFSMPVVLIGYLFVAFALLFRLRMDAKMRLFAGIVLGLVPIQLWFQYHGPTPVEASVNMLIHVTGKTLPNGHVMAGIVLYTSLAYVVWKTQRNWWARLLGLGVSMALIAIAPVSPVLLGQYSFSSAMGGLVVGILWVAGCLITRLLYRSVEKGTYWRIWQ